MINNDKQWQRKRINKVIYRYLKKKKNSSAHFSEN